VPPETITITMTIDNTIELELGSDGVWAVPGPRPLRDIALDIRKNWARINYAAAPYLEVMAGLDRITDRYGHDDAEGIVLRFLGNARSWRGPEARRIKQELRDLLRGA
jgi:hypothetical protein